MFAHFRRLNSLELKGAYDLLTLLDLNLIMMRAWGLGALEPEEASDENPTKDRDRAAERSERGANQLPGQRTVTIVCVTRPDRILDDLQGELRFFSTGEPGIYFCNERLPQWIIYPTELELVPRNYPLLPLAKGEKLKQFIELCLCERLGEWLDHILDVNKLAEAGF